MARISVSFPCMIPPPSQEFVATERHKGSVRPRPPVAPLTCLRLIGKNY